MIQFFGEEQVHRTSGGFEHPPLAVHTVVLVDAHRAVLSEFGYPEVVAFVHPLPGDVIHITFGDAVEDLLRIPYGIEHEQRVVAEVPD